MQIKKDFRGMTLEQLKELMTEIGEKPFRAKQIYPHIFKGINSIQEIGNIPKTLKEKLEEHTFISKVEIHQVLTSSIDQTKKYLMKLEDGNIIEGVLMVYNHGLSICISSQVGCRMGCSFCASTIDGLARNLTAGEMIGQVMAIQQDAGERISNIVLMGSGEPLDNYEELIQFLKVVHEEEGLGIGYRHITISTCGIVPKIYQLAQEGMPINLAISLHETQPQRRALIMPVENAYNSESLMAAARYYAKTTKRRVTFEYALIKDVNDNPQTAMELARLLKGMLSHVNLIPLNPVSEKSYKTSNMAAVKAFCKVLQDQGVEATVRREMGKDINGACGQLRRSAISQEG